MSKHFLHLTFQLTALDTGTAAFTKSLSFTRSKTETLKHRGCKSFTFEKFKVFLLM